MKSAMNPIGVISMQYARPFTAEHFPLFERVRSTGFDFIELLVPEPGELDPRACAPALEAAGLDVVMAARVNAERNIASNDPHVRERGVDYLLRAIDTAVAFGARVLGGPLTGNPLVFAARAPAPVSEAERERRKACCVEALARVARHAEGSGVALALEPLNRFESDVLCTVRQGLEILEAVDHPALGLLLDTFHMAMEEASVAESIRLARGCVVHFQANENHRGFLGTGSIDWTEVCRALRDIHYTGPISLEPFRRDDDRFGVPIAQWRAPHEDEDARLGASVSLLRSQLYLAGYRR